MGSVALRSHLTLPISLGTLTLRFPERDTCIFSSEYDELIPTAGPLHMIPFAWNMLLLDFLLTCSFSRFRF